MANPQGKQQSGPTNINVYVHFDDLVRQVKAANQKLNLLVEHAGMGDKLAELTEQLRGPTENLKAAVDANQPE